MRLCKVYKYFIKVIVSSVIVDAIDVKIASFQNKKSVVELYM